jgi:hypothetical protein
MLEFNPLALAIGADRHLQTMAAGIEEIDRLAEAVRGDADHLYAGCFQPCLAVEQDLLALHLKRQMLNQVGGVRVFLRWRRAGYLEESDIAAVL